MTLRGGILLATALFAPAIASAQPVPVPDPDPADPSYPPPVPQPIDPDDARIPEPITVPAPPEESTYSAVDHTYQRTLTETRPMWRDIGFSLSAGGGASGFTSETARNATQSGGDWDVRATIGTRLPVAAEISYLGSAQTIDALGLDDSAVLVGNGVQAAVRLNLLGDTSLQPFIFAGAAWRRYDLANTDSNTSDVTDNDDVVEFPIGAGLSFRTRQGFLLDARGEFRAATNEDLMPSLTVDGPLGNDNKASLHRWGVTANVGYEF